MCPSSQKTLAAFKSLRKRAREAELRLLKLRRIAFGKCVSVRDNSTLSYGLIVHDVVCPAENVPVFMEWGKVEWYPLESLTRVREARTPGWAKEVGIQRALHRYRPI